MHNDGLKSTTTSVFLYRIFADNIVFGLSILKIQTIQEVHSVFSELSASLVQITVKLPINDVHLCS